jgi:putative flavoprotein involved in K+ transport
MTTRIETAVIGGGQAGLSASFHLSQRGAEHVLLERGRIGETWRSERWDSFRLNTPNWFLQLPGHEYAGSDPNAFLTRDETVAYLESYAGTGNGNVQTGTDVLSLRARPGGGFELDTSTGAIAATNVVVATGSFRKTTPVAATGSVPHVPQLHAREYRNPGQLADGGVLVIGSGQSGCQIAAELNRSGRKVYLSLGRCPSLPFSYRGRLVFDWLVDIGMMDETVDKLPSPAARLAGNPTVASADVGHLIAPRRLAREGVTLIGRVETLNDARSVIRPDANERLAEAAQFDAMFKQRLDDYVAASGIDAPEEVDSTDGGGVAELTELDLRAAGITSIIWANGYRPDYGWIDLPVFDADGWPVHKRGVTGVDGLYFVGVHWLHKRKSALLLGVGEDAEHVVSTIVDGKRTKEEG